jgi:Zn-dependent peptidase ImmA (M78 family)/transcriptional regulator with XRE-family HTH domain
MFNGDRLRQARELRLLTQSDLARRVRKSQAAIANIEGCFNLPSPELVAALAAHTRFPASFFSSEKGLEFPMESLMFRSRSATTRREAIAACRYAEIVYEVIALLARFVTPVPIRLARLPRTPAAIAAQQTRRILNISPDEPVEHLIHELEKSGVIVLALPLDLKRIDAFSSWVPGTGASQIPVVAVCSGRPGDRLRWNVAHELGHLVLHGHLKHLRKEQHQEADQFAAEFLLPEKSIRTEIFGPVTLSSLAPLKPRWMVSIQSLVYRAHDLSLISRRQYAYLFEQLSARGWRLKEPPNLDVEMEKPRLLSKMAEVAFGMPVDIGRIAAEAKLSTQMVEEILSGYEVIEQQQMPIFSDKVIRFSVKNNNLP